MERVCQVAEHEVQEVSMVGLKVEAEQASIRDSRDQLMSPEQAIFHEKPLLEELGGEFQQHAPASTIRLPRNSRYVKRN